MYTSAALLDIHERTHRSIQLLLDHLAGLPEADLHRSLDGFSYATVVLQLHHLLGAERYWLRILANGELVLDDDEADYGTIDDLRVLRERVAADTRAFLAQLSDAEASTPRSVTTYGGNQIDVSPAHVLLRTQTHAYQHHGEIASMLRQAGHTFPQRLDFPLT
jgi:uncharacterized damage-inducible protein DinB